jgi:RHS repeat-associated protein
LHTSTPTTGTGATADILYAGGVTTGGLDHFGARYYDPTTATWTQPDPINQISNLTQAHHYTYVGGNPVSSTDPTGAVPAGSVAADLSSHMNGSWRASAVHPSRA